MVFHENSQHMRVMQLRYRSKYRDIKREIKNLVLENAALADEVAQVQGDLIAAREERRYLAKRLLRYGVEPSSDPTTNQPETTQIANTTTEGTPVAAPKKRGPKKRTPSTTAKPEKKKPKNARERIKINGNAHSITIHTIGEIIPINPNFHTEYAIYPVGFIATRIYAHPLDPRRKCVYTCKILNNSGKPQFQIIPDNDLDSVFFGDTADTCHQELLEALQRSLSELNTTTPFSLTVQGDKFFGLTNSMVKALLQMDSGFPLCARFVGFPAHDNNSGLPEDKDPALSFDALQSMISAPAVAPYHALMPVVRDVPPDELLNLQ